MIKEIELINHIIFNSVLMNVNEESMDNFEKSIQELLDTKKINKDKYTIIFYDYTLKDGTNITLPQIAMFKEKV